MIVKKMFCCVILICLGFSNCNSDSNVSNRQSRPFYGEINQADTEYIESQMEEIKNEENDSI